MKLGTKLTLFNTISKMVIVVLFVLLLPVLIKDINRKYTDNWLHRQKDKVLQTVRSQGIEKYIQNGEGFGSYNALLKEEYVSMDVDSVDRSLDTIVNERRLVEGDTIQYRILSHNFRIGKKMESGEITRDDLMRETQEMVNKMREMGGADQFADMLKGMARILPGPRMHFSH